MSKIYNYLDEYEKELLFEIDNTVDPNCLIAKHILERYKNSRDLLLNLLIYVEDQPMQDIGM